MDEASANVFLAELWLELEAKGKTKDIGQGARG